MINRRDALRLTLAVAGSGVLSNNPVLAQSPELLKFLCPPDGATPDLVTRPSPPSRPFVAPLNVMPVSNCTRDGCHSNSHQCDSGTFWPPAPANAAVAFDHDHGRQHELCAYWSESFPRK